MFKTQLVTSKGDVIKTFISSSRPSTRFGSEGVEIRSNDDKNNFMIMGSFNVIVEEVIYPFFTTNLYFFSFDFNCSVFHNLYLFIIINIREYTNYFLGNQIFWDKFNSYYHILQVYHPIYKHLSKMLN